MDRGAAKEGSAVTVHVPGPLRKECGGAATLRVAAADVCGVLEALEREYPSLHRGVCDETGAVRRHINIFINNANMRDGDGVSTALSPGDSVIILPAVSGGNHG